ncbi:hypothetical protein JHV675_51300 [Mycobacterium avium subsp. hominissuis]
MRPFLTRPAEAHPQVLIIAQWERWTGSTTPPQWRLIKRAKVDKRGGIKWITFPDTINGVDVIVEMPENAPTKSCHENRHDHCPHRLVTSRGVV